MKSFSQNTEIHTNCMKREDFAMQILMIVTMTFIFYLKRVRLPELV